MIIPDQAYIEIREKTKKFVNCLEGKYKGYITDECLGVLLAKLMERQIGRIPVGSTYSLDKIAYDAGQFIFESVLEDKCEAACNGHHAAQNLAEMFTREK